MPIVNDDGVHETELDSVAFTLPPELKKVYITKDDPAVKEGTDPNDDKMVITPQEYTRGQELDRFETDPTTGIGLEVNLQSLGGSSLGFESIDWSKLNQPFGSVKSTSKEDTPVVATTASPLVKITEGDIGEAINVGMGAGPGIIAGEKSFTAPARALGKAMSMSGFKDSPEAIRKATGWFKGTDGKWKYEISDEGMKLADRDWKYGETGKLKDFIEHPELFKAYPEIGEINFKVAEKGERDLGSFNSRTKTLMINPEKIPAGEEGLLDTIVHELQHVVQRKEGFAYGSNPKAALEDVVTSLVQKMKETKDPEAKREMMELFLDIHNNVQKFAEYMYLRVPGEVEANIVAARRKLPDNLRKEFSVEEHQRMVEGEKNTLHGGNYVPEFIYPK